MVVCNKTPGADGTKKAVDLYGTLVGLDTGKTEIKFKLPKDKFACFKDPNPPPGPPPPIDPTDPKVGVSCNKAKDRCGVDPDDDTDPRPYCCGVFADGYLLDHKGKQVDGSTAFNAVACNINPDTGNIPETW